MNWFLIALINPFAHALVNHFDKYLISKYMKGGSVGTLILFSALFAIVTLPIIYAIHPDIFATITFGQAIILMINGALLVTAIICYLYALNYDEASYVAPFFQLVPVFGFFLGYLILGETLRSHQFFAAALIVGGSTVLSFQFTNGKAHMKKQLVLLMLGSSILYAINAVIFKSIAVQAGFVDSLFWDMAGKVVFGVILFCAIRSYREQFIELIKVNRFSIVGLNAINEILSLVGEIAIVLAVLYAPVVLVQSVGGLQPVFVFILGLLITLLWPKFGQESLNRATIIQKIIGIAIVTLGAYLLAIN